MDALAFYGLVHDREGATWQLPVVPELCSPLGALFGGCGLGAAIAALERVTERPLVWATAQFLDYARPPAVVELEVEEVVRGHATSQGRVRGHVGGQEIFTILAALGQRTLAFEGEWAKLPDVPPPLDCPPRPPRGPVATTVTERMEIRVARFVDADDISGSLEDGRSALWVRNPWGSDAQAAALAVVGDFVPLGIRQASAQRTVSSSLDNTLRMVRVHPTEWILADIRVHAVAAGFGHGLVHLWAEDGTLLATASQSAIVHARPEWEDPARG